MTDDRKAKYTTRKIIANANTGPPRLLEAPGSRIRRIENVGSRRDWLLRNRDVKISPDEPHPAFIILTEDMSIGWHGTISVQANLKIFKLL
jgi:hypothetical protein